MTATSKSFVFVELLDPEVIAVLTALRTILSDKIQKTSIHITLRGPYRTDAIWSFLEKMNEESFLDPIFFNGFDKFSNADQNIVYVKAQSELFDRFLYKPDFPKKIFGSNPHVTIYEGSNKIKADAIYQFLKKEKFYFICKHYKFTPFIKKQQLNLDFSAQSLYTEENFVNLIQQGKINSGILTRAEKLAAQFK
jgi:hypothetical protein